MDEFILSKRWKRKGWDFDKKYDINDDKTFFIVLNEFMREVQEATYSLFDTDGIERLLKAYDYRADKLPNSKKIAEYVNMHHYFIKLIKPMIVYAILKKHKLMPWYSVEALARELKIRIPKPTLSGISYENLSLISSYDKLITIKKLSIDDTTTEHDVLSMCVSIMYSLLNMRDVLIERLGFEKDVSCLLYTSPSPRD